MPPSLRWLKWLVTALTFTLILGVITIVGLLVTRLPMVGGSGAGGAFPETLALPEGAEPQAVTRGAAGWVAVVTKDNRILIFDSQGRLTQEVQIAP